MTATIYDVAKQAGVGIGTVSRVLNNSPKVRAGTRERVLAVIDTLNYRPNPIAQRLSLRKTLTIGVIVPFFTRPSVVERLRGVEAYIAESEYDLTVYNIETITRRDASFYQVPDRQRVDGVIIISLTPSDEDVARWAEREVPVILVDAKHPSLSQAVIDDVAGGYMATEHLIQQGHRRIAYISDVFETSFSFTSSRFRYMGYRQALTDYDISFRPGYHAMDEHGREEARRLTHELLERPDPPSAIFAASDTQALGILEAARERNLLVPANLSVVGYDDVEIAQYLGLTTIRQPLFISGWRGAELLFEAIKDPGAEAVLDLLPVELIVRGTTGPPGERFSQPD